MSTVSVKNILSILGWQIKIVVGRIQYRPSAEMHFRVELIC
jgi:hypothetical protein